MKLFISMLILIMAFGANAASVCETVPDCVALIKLANARIDELNQAAENANHVSNAGAIFIRDTSIPALGKAYKDPSGLIWGSPIVTNGQINRMTQSNAGKYCQDIGSRLPTKDEYIQLAKYLGAPQSYNPYLTDGKTEILPDLSQYDFVSSSVQKNDPLNIYYFDGRSGNIVSFYHGSEDGFAVRCVFGR